MRNDIKTFQNSAKLLISDMTAFRFVKVLERWLQKYSISNYYSSHILNSTNHDILFLICEIL